MDIHREEAMTPLLNTHAVYTTRPQRMVWYGILEFNVPLERSFRRRQPWAVMNISHSVMEGQRHNNPLNPRCFCLQRPKRPQRKGGGGTKEYLNMRSGGRNVASRNTAEDNTGRRQLVCGLCSAGTSSKKWVEICENPSYDILTEICVRLHCRVDLITVDNCVT